MKQKDRILFRSLTTPDGTVLISHNRHDYVTHDDANGKHYMLDGGLDYCRCTVHGDEIITTITDADPFELIRDNFYRGARGKSGDQPLKWIKLSEMTDEHLQATIEYCFTHRATLYVDIYEEEQKYRQNNELRIEESN